MTKLAANLLGLILIVVLRFDLGYGSPTKTFQIQMPGAVPKGQDSYICSSFDLNKVGPEETAYITKFEAVEAAADRVHHMLLYTCSEPSKTKTWDCRHHQVKI